MTTERNQEVKHAYEPNHIPAFQRWFYGLGSLAILAYGMFGLWVDDIFLPGKRSKGMHFHGLEAWFLFGAIVCVAAGGFSVIVDHFDRRDNELNYRRFAKVTTFFGWSLFIISICIPFVRAFSNIGFVQPPTCYQEACI